MKIHLTCKKLFLRWGKEKIVFCQNNPTKKTIMLIQKNLIKMIIAFNSKGTVKSRTSIYDLLILIIFFFIFLYDQQ